LISGIYTCIEARNRLSTAIMERSLIEYVVDMLLLALLDSERSNRQFNSYGVLIRHWYSPKLVGSEFEARIPTFAEEYRTAVKCNWPEIYEKCVEGRKIEKLQGLPAEALRDKLAETLGLGDPGVLGDASLDGLASIARVVPVQEGSDEHWIAIDREMKRRFLRHWSGMTFHLRVDRVVQAGDKRLRGIDAYLRAYSLLSNYIHPTRYTVGHKFVQLDRGYAKGLASAKDMEHTERNLFHASNYLATGLALALGNNGGDSVWRAFWRRVGFSSNLSKYILQHGAV